MEIAHVCHYDPHSVKQEKTMWRLLKSRSLWRTFYKTKENYVEIAHVMVIVAHILQNRENYVGIA